MLFRMSLRIPFCLPFLNNKSRIPSNTNTLFTTPITHHVSCLIETAYSTKSSFQCGCRRGSSGVPRATRSPWWPGTRWGPTSPTSGSRACSTKAQCSGKRAGIPPLSQSRLNAGGNSEQCNGIPGLKLRCELQYCKYNMPATCLSCSEVPSYAIPANLFFQYRKVDVEWICRSTESFCLLLNSFHLSSQCFPSSYCCTNTYCNITKYIQFTCYVTTCSIIRMILEKVKC